MFYSDKPISAPTEDQLNRSGFAKLLAHALSNLESQDTFTVGLFGKWGCGKTSIVNMALSELEKAQQELPPNEQMIVVHFEPWNFSDTNQLLTQFFIRLSNEFRSKGDTELAKVGDALQKYSEAFGVFELIPGIAGAISALGKAGASALGDVLQKGSNEKDVLKQKEFVIELLKKQPNRILVVIDDIDRLSNEQIRYIFQLITSVAKFPNTAYLLVFDKEIVVNALSNVQSGNGEDYLEKIIQMPIQIPEIQQSDLRKVLFQRLDTVISQFKDISFPLEHWQRLFEPCVAPFINHLRDINRLCNALQFKLSAISAEVDFTDMVAISVLEINHPQVFEWVRYNKPILTGENDWSRIGATNKTSKDWYAQYTDIIKTLLKSERVNSDDTAVDLVLKFLSDLFPYFGQKIGKTYEVYDLNRFIKNNQIAHPDKFDRYFELSVDNVGYRTADVRNLIINMTKEQIVEYLLLQEKIGTCYEFLKDICARIQDISASRARILVSALLKVSCQLKSNSQKTGLSVSTEFYAVHMILDLVAQIPAEERLMFLQECISDTDSDALQVIAMIINMLELAYGRLSANGAERGFNKVITLDELIVLEGDFSERTKHMLGELSMFDFTEWRMIYHLLENFDPAFTNSYLDTALCDDTNVLKFFSQFVNSWHGAGVEYEIQNQYTERFTATRILEAIKTCREKGQFFNLPVDVQNKAGAFYLSQSGDATYSRGAYQTDVDTLLDSWRN